MGINRCPICLEKQRKIDELSEEVQRLKAALRRQERQAEEGFFGSSTPSSKKPVKENAAEKEKKPKGRRPGHQGNGRRSYDPATSGRTVEIEEKMEICPDCGGHLRDKGFNARSVLDSPPIKAEPVVYRLPKKYCPHCRRTFIPQTPGVLPKSLYGNQLIANAVAMHYLHGMPMGRICEQTGLSDGSLVAIFHRVAHLFEPLIPQLIDEFRMAPVKHADETGWRTEAKNGYVWLFATPDMSLFQFGQRRSAKVPHAVFGPEPLPGVLVVDRYNAYNKLPCAIQYCYAHLLREIQDLEKDFPRQPEVQTFVATVAPDLALAMSLRSQPVNDLKFYAKVDKVKNRIKTAMNQEAKNLGIRRIQDIFRQNEHRLYHWAEDRRVPADNNLAERDLRPSVIARKVSFGSITDSGAKTRSILTSVVSTLRKKGYDEVAAIKQALDHMAKDLKQNPYLLLFQKKDP